MLFNIRDIIDFAVYNIKNNCMNSESFVLNHRKKACILSRPRKKTKENLKAISLARVGLFSFLRRALDL